VKIIYVLYSGILLLESLPFSGLSSDGRKEKQLKDAVEVRAGLVERRGSVEGVGRVVCGINRSFSVGII
jgi:hypothetical protein